jgi:TPR repeat protein
VLAADWYRKSANQGLAVGQYNLACLYFDAKGVFKDTVKAKELFEKAAAQGYGDAHYMLGYMYQQGDGVSRDRQMAVQWYRSALSKRPLTENHKAHAEKFLTSNP